MPLRCLNIINDQRDALLSDDSGSNDYNGSSLGTSSHSKPNVVLDPRAVTNSSAPLAVMGHSAAPPSSSQLLSPPGSGGSLAKRPSGGSSIGLIKPPGPMSRQISVPAGVPDAMNEALVLDEGLRTQAMILLVNEIKIIDALTYYVVVLSSILG